MSKTSAALLRGDALTSAKVICILTHGRGQSPEAMDQDILQRLSVTDVAFVLPRAANGSWYDAKAVDPLTEKTREQLSASLGTLRAITSELPAATPILIAGFSQGACLSIEYAMTYGAWNGALVALTGCRVGQASDDKPNADVRMLPAYVSGSNADPWIPLTAFTQAAHEFGAAGARLRTDVFPGRAHEVSDVEIGVLQQALSSLAMSGEVRW
jgi:phospholipase/carboxylesterase